MRIIMQPTKEVAYSETFSTNQSSNATLVCNGLESTESVSVQIFDPVTKEFHDWLVDGDVQQMDAKNNVIEIYLSSGTFRVHKTATSNAVGVSLTQIY